MHNCFQVQLWRSKITTTACRDYLPGIIRNLWLSQEIGLVKAWRVVGGWNSYSQMALKIRRMVEFGEPILSRFICEGKKNFEQAMSLKFVGYRSMHFPDQITV